MSRVSPAPLRDGSSEPQAAASQPRTQRLLHGPILPTLLRLAFPNLGEAVARVAFITCDALFVSWLGTDALAGVALAFPIFLVIQMISASGFGSGVASAIARALGAGRREEADHLAGQAVSFALVAGLATAALMLLFGESLYRLMGAEGAALHHALVYSNLVFGGGALVWLMNISANAVRGTGNMLLPAAAIVLGEMAHLTLSPALILGWGPLPQLGAAGAALGVLAAYGVGALILLTHLFMGRGLLAPARAHLRPSRRPLGAILGVGTFSALNVLQFQISTLVLTGFVGLFGTATLAGFGAAFRLELLQLPVTFAFGSAIITLIATNAGAGHYRRVARIAWTGAALTAAIGALFAAVALLLPAAWLGVLSDEADVLAAGTQYLRLVGPTYPLLGCALGLFFACLGAGRAAGSFAMGLLRLAVIGIGGAVAIYGLQQPASALYLVVAAAYVAYGLGMLFLTWRLMRGLYAEKAAAPQVLPGAPAAR